MQTSEVDIFFESQCPLVGSRIEHKSMYGKPWKKDSKENNGSLGLAFIPAVLFFCDHLNTILWFVDTFLLVVHNDCNSRSEITL